MPIHGKKALVPTDGEEVVLDTDFTYPSAGGIFVGVGGDVSAVTAGGTTLVFKGIASGSILPVSCTQVTTANTTATDMIALFG